MPSCRVLFTTTSGTGHLMPLVPVIEAARGVGHTVAIAAPEEISTTVSTLGLDCLPFGGMTLDDPERAAVFERMGETPESEIEALIGREIFGRINTTAALPRLLDSVRSWRPDIVVSDVGEIAGSIASDVMDVPWMRITPTMTSLHGFDHHMASGVSELRRGHGLVDDVRGDRLIGAPLVGYFPAPFEGDDALPDTLRIADPRLGRRAATPEDLVYVTFGTESSGMPFFADLVRASMEAVAAVGLHAVVATGRGVDVEQFGSPPHGVEIVDWVDQGEVVARARAVLCHSGAGTTLAALAAGVPLVAVPLFADQPHVAARVDATGCGVVVGLGPDMVDALSAALSSVVENPPEGSAAMRTEIDALAGASAAVGLIDRVAAGSAS